MNWRNDAIADIKSDEGCRLISYQDGGGVWTIGYGHTAGADPGNTCTQAQADIWLIQDAGTAERELNNNASWWISAPDPVRRGLLNMTFNLGWPRLSKFTQMLIAGENAQYNLMANEAKASLWAIQVGARATRIANLFRSAVQMELPV